MKRKIYCKFFKKNMTGLEFQIYPGKLGKKIYDEISKKAWNKWIKKQTIIINEKKLNMLFKKDQKIIYKEMIKFLYKKSKKNKKKKKKNKN